MSKFLKALAIVAIVVGGVAAMAGTAEARWGHHHGGWRGGGYWGGWGWGYPGYAYYPGPYYYGGRCGWVRAYRGPYGWRRVWRCW